MIIPHHPDEITAAWLTDALLSTGTLTHGRVVSCDTQPLATDKGMTASIVRVRVAYTPDAGEAPQSLIAKFSAPDPEARALIHGMGFYEREVGFYQQLASQSRVRVPRCFFSAIDLADGTAILLLEDLETACNGSWAAGCSVAEAELVVGALALLHASWWQQPQLEEQQWLELRSLVSVEQIPVFFQHAWEPFLARYDAPIPDDLLQVGAWLQRDLAWLCVHLYRKPPLTLVHNDCQADNLFFARAGAIEEIVAIDWQVTTRGRAALDVAMFVAGHLEPDRRRQHEQRLLGHYHALLVANGVGDYSFTQCWDDYRLAVLLSLARIITVIGIGAATDAQTGEYCDIIIPRYCQTAHDLAVGDLLSAAAPDHT